MGVVVLGWAEGTVAQLGEDMLRATSVRIARRGQFRITAGGRPLDLTAKLDAQELEPLDRVDLIWE